MTDGFTLDNLPLDAQTLILCATTRQAQSIREDFSKRRAANGEHRWSSLNIQTIDQWFGSLSDDLLLRGLGDEKSSAKLVLSGMQEQLIFEQIIEQSIENVRPGISDLFDVASMAKNAVEAHRLSRIWNFKLDQGELTKEQESFKIWRREFDARCQKAGWIDEARDTLQLLERLKTTDIALPKQVIFAGLDRETPIERDLKALLAAKKVAIHELIETTTANNITKTAYQDAHSELLAAALWAQSHFQSNPSARIGIVVPNLGACRDQVQDIFDSVFTPTAYRSAFAEQEKPFNISLGQPLSDYPIIGIAFEMFSVMGTEGKLERSQISRLLLSPFWSAGRSDMDARSRLEAFLRQGTSPKATLRQFDKFLRLKEQCRTIAPHALLEHLNALQIAAAACKKNKLPSAWSEQFIQSLKRCGWLEEYVLSSAEFQTRKAFFDEIQRLGSLDPMVGETSAHQTIALLKRLCGERIFQPQTIGQPNVQILGMLEASGLSFDALWVCGMNAHVWPPAARPNPLLSAEEQRSKETPNASAAVQTAYAKRIFDRLSRSAPEVIYSWPRTENGSELAPSPLLNDPDESKATQVDDVGWVHQAASSGGTNLAPPIEDSLAPAVPENHHVKGGTWILRAQAICPAWAFYQYRLGAQKTRESEEGLDASKRGTVVHDALEHFWKTVVSSKRLEDLSPEQRHDTIVAAVEEALCKLEKKPEQDALKPKFRELERQRVIKLLDQWVQFEVGRGDHFDVIANEDPRQFDISGLKFNMRLDRLELQGNSKLLVIDYKTGSSIDIKNWASDRITEPQLPIYAAFDEQEHRPDDQKVSGVLFAKVRMRDPEIVGVTDNIEPKSPNAFTSTAKRKIFEEDKFKDWDSILLHWKTRITAVADEIKQGEAGVRVKVEKDLAYCDVLPLLRLAERKLQMEQWQSEQTRLHPLNTTEGAA